MPPTSARSVQTGAPRPGAGATPTWKSTWRERVHDAGGSQAQEHPAARRGDQRRVLEDLGDELALLTEGERARLAQELHLIALDGDGAPLPEPLCRARLT